MLAMNVFRLLIITFPLLHVFGLSPMFFFSRLTFIFINCILFTYAKKCLLITKVHVSGFPVV